MHDELTLPPRRHHRAIGIVLSLVAIIGTALLGGAVVFGLFLSDVFNPLAFAWVLSGTLFFVLLSVWLFYRFAFTRPKQLSKRGLYIVSLIGFASAAFHIAIGSSTGWQSLYPAAAALVFAITALALASSKRDA